MADQLATFIVIVPQIVGNLESWQLVYSSDLVRHPSRAAAIRYGWRVHDHDDWLLGVMVGDRLVRAAWQYEDRDDPDELADIARQLCLTLAPSDPATDTGGES